VSGIHKSIVENAISRDGFHFSHVRKAISVLDFTNPPRKKALPAWDFPFPSSRSGAGNSRATINASEITASPGPDSGAVDCGKAGACDELGMARVQYLED